MNEGLFKSQINAIPAILKSLDLFADRNYNPLYPSNPRALFKHLDYLGIWTKCFAELYFDFQLAYDSLLQFKVDSYNPLAFSYVYYECPLIPAISFPEY